MPLSTVVSPSPCLYFDEKHDNHPARDWLDFMRGPDGWRLWWIVPTSRRRRQMLHETTTACRLPRGLTLDGLMQHLEGFGRTRRRLVGNTGRLLRIARAWNGSLTPGRVAQLDRIAAEWRDSGSPPSSQHLHSGFLENFNRIMAEDGCVDRPAALDELAKEIADDKSPLAKLLHGKRILFDGFHRFSERELNLIEAVGKHADVLLWLVACAEQPHHENANHIIERLKIKPIRDERDAATALARFGRSIFANGECETTPIEIFEAPTMAAECHTIAAQIKKLMGELPGSRLSDIAVVIPDDSYLPVLKDTFRAARIDFSPAAEVFALAESRPARVLLSALRLIQHGWPAEALFDFLRQPVVFRRLSNYYLLEWLRKRSPLAVAKHDWKTWHGNWKDLIANHEMGILGDEEERDDDPQERVDRAKEVGKSLRTLLGSIDQVLAPVAKLEKELGKNATNNPQALVAAIANLLDAINLAGWLNPPQPPNWEIVPAREWEIDQLAFNNLKDVLIELHETPLVDFPRDPAGKIDVEFVLKLALSAETFQTSAEDDAGVQILRPRTIRGSKFRAIFAVGLVEGKVPRDSGRLSADDKDSVIGRLREQEQREQEYLFTQLFESAQERIILLRPAKDTDAPLMESSYLSRVRKKLGDKKALQPKPTIIDLPHALLFSDRPEVRSQIESFLTKRDIWNHRQADNDLHIEQWAMPLLKLRYPPERAFSATALEKYASCPFQHFAAKTLGLDELERDDAAMRWGSFLHDVLDRFFKERPESASTSVRERFLDLFHKHWPGVAHTLDATYLHDVETALAHAFETVNAFLAKEGFEQIGSEWEEKAIEIPDGKGGTLRLHVKIDRIDRRASDGSELICDFKTGNVTSGGILKERIRVGRALQLPLYGYGRQIAAEGVRVVHGLYVKLSRRLTDATPDKHAPFLVSVGDALDLGRRKPIPFVPEEAGRIAVEKANQMRAGLIALSAFDADHKDPACVSYCSARHACRHPKGYKTN